MNLVIKKDYGEASRWAAEYIAGMVNECPSCVLGLPTGSSPLGIYRELVFMHKAGKVSFKDAVTYNMDEYLGLDAGHEQSYHRFMWENFFSQIDIRRENVHILDGTASDPRAECEAYEKSLRAAGVRLFLGGVGQNGHVAFNEPGSPPDSVTRVINLSADTRSANARFFGGDPDRVPAQALTVGLGTIMSAAELLIIVSGGGKARALRAAVEGGINHLWPVSFLQTHSRAVIVCDEAATEELTVGTVRHFKGLETG
jgi:glucosamine-6-phosphate deaminase